MTGLSGISAALSVTVIAGAILSPATAAGIDKSAVQALYEKAKTEREVVVWGPTVGELDWIQPALAKNYPGITVRWNADVRSPPKIIAEARAGKTSLDVLVFSLGGMLPIQQRELLGTTDWKAFGVSGPAVFFGGQAGATHNIVYSVAHNTKLVKASDLPKTWQGFLDDKWTGKLMATPFLLPRLAGFLAMEWGEDKTADWLRVLINDRKVMITDAPQESILGPGERTVSITTFANTVSTLARDGVPVDWAVMEIVPAVQFAAAPFKNAPHPDAARFVAGWLASDEASAAREAANFASSVLPGATSKIAKDIAAAKGRVIVEAPDNMAVREDFYKKLSPIVTGQKK
jgi:ABC-type Fe3+ transport system substrate-binding protein